MKVDLILCKYFITYPNSVSVLISFVFSSWIINEFEDTEFSPEGVGLERVDCIYIYIYNKKN